jgi:lipid-binding SYLF domain-containing protein
MTSQDPSLRPLLDQAVGYVVFPEIKQGGAIVGGAGGKGVVYEHGVPTGYAELSQASIGAQIGGQTFAELVIVRDAAMLQQLKQGKFEVGGQASATMLRAGAASATEFNEKGLAVVVMPHGGAMLNLSLTGQRIRMTG